jgi:hypothetical protein
MVQSFFPGHWIPFLLAIYFGMLIGVHDSSERGCDDHSLHGRCIGLDGFQNTRSSFNSRVKEVLYGVLNIEVEWRCGMKNIIEWRARLDGLLRFN